MTTLTTTSFTIRRAAPDDADGILFVWQETADMLARVDNRYKLNADAAATWRASLLECLGNKEIAVFVAESGANTAKPGHILGYIIGTVSANLPTLMVEKFGFVSDLAVDSHGKSSGIGRGLFDALKGWFQDRGVSQVQARVPTRHPVAQAFWRALGASELYEQLWLKLDERGS